MKYLIGIVGIVFSVTSVTAAPIYQWVDANGRTVFSDQPPEGVAQIQQSGIQTDMPNSEPPQDQPYSIQSQVEFFQSMAEREQKMRLERKMAQQAIEESKAQQDNYAMPPLNDGLPPIVPIPAQPYYYPPPPQYSRYPVPNRMVTPGFTRNPYGYPVYTGPRINYTHQGDHHRFNLKLGGYGYPHLNYWKF